MSDVFLTKPRRTRVSALPSPMIRNFTDRDTEQLFRTEKNRRFSAIAPPK